MNIKLQSYFDALNNNYVLICTSNVNEKKAVNKIILHRCELVTNMTSLGCSIGLINGKFVIHLTGESGIEANISISRLIIEFIKRESNPNPRLILLSGFCWGNPKKVNKNDIIVSSDIISLNSDSYFQNEKKYKSTPYASSINAKFIENKIENVIPGTMVSLESLIAKTSKRDEIIDMYPHILGGEMEAFGFVPSIGSIPWAVVKAISDFADDQFNRNSQEIAASKAADVVKEMIDIYQSEGYFRLNSTSSECLSLVNSLYGNEIKITDKEVNSANLNDYIDNLSPLIQYKLGYYLTGDQYGDDFLKYFCYLILETTQNSFKHGGATKVTINFGEKSVFIQDDGKDFDLNGLIDGRGGAFSWSKFKENFIDTGHVKYCFEKKKHKFKLIKINCEITRIINNCTAKIVANKIGSGWGNSSILSYEPTCEAVYIDDRRVFIPSRRFHLVDEAKRIIESGKVVFVSVNDKENGELYNELGFGPDKLKVMIHN